MVNRFTNITPSSFTPLTLQEIMAVPLAKQKQHDELLAGADEFTALKSQRLSQDADAVDARLGELRGRADDISSSLLEGGVSRDLMGQLRRLKREKEVEFGQEGLVGSAAANFASATKFVNDLATKKEQQAGWSPARAKAWAQKQVAGFKGTDAGDGTFRTFQGQGLATKVDFGEFIENAIDNISEKVEPTALQAIRVGGLPAFNRAFQSGEITSVDYNRIMESVVMQAKNNPDLLASLEQEAFFTGETNPTDFGDFSYQKDESGKIISRKWNVGNSMAARRLAGAAIGAAFENTTIDYKILKDDLAFFMHKKGLEEQDALSLVNFSSGEMNQLDRSNFDSIKDNLEIAQQELGAVEIGIEGKRNALIANGIDPDTDRQYQKMQSDYAASKIKYSNAQARLDNVYKNVDKRVLTDKERKLLDVVEVIEGSASLKKTAEDLGIELVPGFSGSNEIKLKIMEKMGVKTSDVSRNADGLYNFDNITEDVRETRNAGAKKYLAANPQAEYFTRLNAESTGKFATKIGRMNVLLSENFTPGSATLAYGKGRLDDAGMEDQIGKPSEKGYIYKVELTDGWDDNGQKFNNLIVTNPDTGKVASYQIIDNLNSDFYNEAAAQLGKGSFTQRKMANDLRVGSAYMPGIKRSNMAFQDKGEFGGIPFSDRDGNALPVKWEKHSDASGEFFTASIGGVPLNDGQSIQGEKEMAIAVDNFVQSKIPKE